VPKRSRFAGSDEDVKSLGMQMHAGQLSMSTESVRELIGRQFPQWRGWSVRSARSQGTVNAIFRIGTGVAARFPLQPCRLDLLDGGSSRRLQRRAGCWAARGSHTRADRDRRAWRGLPAAVVSPDVAARDRRDRTGPEQLHPTSPTTRPTLSRIAADPPL
jgi:hypothetical protein